MEKAKIGLVFYISVAILVLAVLVGIFAPDALENMTSNAQSFISTRFGWYYLIVVSLFVLVCLYIIVSPYGKIKLGKPDDKPEYNMATWFAMLFSAGMGIGLVFWGAAEPVYHYATNSPTAEVGTDEAIKEAMRFTFFHWGIHAWGIYAIIALCLAYFKFRRDARGTVSSTLNTIMNTEGTIGKIIDIIAVTATVSGVATTLGFGAVQINGGLSFMTNINNGFWTQFVIIVVVTILFLLSASTGLDKGIRILSNTNMVIAAFLFVFVLIFGPTLYSLNIFTDTLGKYFQTLPAMSFRLAPLTDEARDWIDNWTIFYWAWWIAWSPFVGTFIARVSKGRTLRQFTAGVLFVPSLVGFLWFSVFGGASILLESEGTAAISELATEESLFGVFEHYPFGIIMSILAIGLIGTFFITSADSATFVLGMQTSDGSLNPTKKVKFIWGILLSATAVILLYSGGLQALENTMIVAAFPFSVIILLMILALFKALKEEKPNLKAEKEHKKTNSSKG
ncbi:glycine betaine transporter [Salibacterium salarium]|uniref:glycine betaine uptake BCCT transporter n=1 Tax=Salibacterium salarium TaxID=284579 RepID=UPI00278B7A12|nr:BCCT family transporter [Salibacterium salarium]MDQ0299290.1 glycine betaine transporter [Salibacterium salarium]